ncbi:MAG: ATP-binding protein, partial [Syntrophales bacterium]|nr:ATP-binding protein [Syntrophales bacterium]
TGVVEGMKPRYFALATDAGPALGILYPTIYDKDASIHVVGVISFSQPRLEIVSRARVFLIMSISLLLLTIVFLIIITFDRLIGRPLNNIAVTIDRFQQGRYTDRIPVKKDDEIGHLARHFNEMAGEIEKVMARNEELTRHLQERVQEETLKVAQLQQEVNQLQRLATIGHLTANLSHDIGTPIHSIQGFAQLLLEREGWPSDVRRKLELIAQQAQRLNVTIQNIKKMTKPPEPRFEVTTVEDLLNETLPLMEPQIQAAGIDLVVDVAERLPPLYLDRYRVQTALLNLVQNAVEAIKGGKGRGKITVIATADLSSASIRIAVWDDGPGIAPHHLPRVCEPFYSTHSDEGLRGLGLAIARDVMKIHGGEVEITSTPGEGTQATLVFPLARAERPHDTSGEPEPRSRP